MLTTIQACEPITAAPLDLNYRPGSDPLASARDGLDVEGTDVWLSYDVGDIYRNGVLWGSVTDTNLSVLPTWTQAGSNVTRGWSGFEVACGSACAVAVQAVPPDPDDETARTLVRIDKPLPSRVATPTCTLRLNPLSGSLGGRTAPSARRARSAIRRGSLPLKLSSPEIHEGITAPPCAGATLPAPEQATLK